jgi:hypothetical protein
MQPLQRPLRIPKRTAYCTGANRQIARVAPHIETSHAPLRRADPMKPGFLSSGAILSPQHVKRITCHSTVDSVVVPAAHDLLHRRPEKDGVFLPSVPKSADVYPIPGNIHVRIAPSSIRECRSAAGSPAPRLAGPGGSADRDVLAARRTRRWVHRTASRYLLSPIRSRYRRHHGSVPKFLLIVFNSDLAVFSLSQPRQPFLVECASDGTPARYGLTESSCAAGSSRARSASTRRPRRRARGPSSRTSRSQSTRPPPSSSGRRSSPAAPTCRRGSGTG